MCGWKDSVDDVLQRHRTSSQAEPASTPEAIWDQQSSGGSLEKYQCTGAPADHARRTPFRDYELSTSSAISRKLTVGYTPYNPVTLSRSSSVKKAFADSCESHT